MKTNSIYACAFWTNRIKRIFALHLQRKRQNRTELTVQTWRTFLFHFFLSLSRLESSRSLTIWFIATYFFRFDCLCSIKFADKIQSKVFQRRCRRLNICFAHLFSFVAVFRKTRCQMILSQSLSHKTCKTLPNANAFFSMFVQRNIMYFRWAHPFHHLYFQ